MVAKSRRLFKIGFFVLLVSAGPVAARAQTDIYTYNLSLPTFTDGSPDGGSFSFEFSWLGPLEYNAPGGSDCPNGCPVVTPGTPGSEYFYEGGMSFSDTTSPAQCSGSTSGGCATVTIPFFFSLPAESPVGGSSLSDQTLTFTLVEDDAFWAQAPGTYNFDVGDEGGYGASYLFQGLTQLPDPPCPEGDCQVTITTVPATPEPASWMLILAGTAGLGFGMRRRLAAHTA